MNNISLISFSTWNITMSLNMMHSCGIGLNPHCLMMHYSLHHASTMHLVMKTSGPQLKKHPWVHICRNFPVVLGSLMALWLKSTSHGKNEAHHTWFNGWKKIYAMNNMIIVDHHGLFIYVDPSYLGSYHDVNILWHSSVYRN